MANYDTSYSINLHYIRAAIEANTGVRLTLERTRELLVEEGLITKAQARKHAKIFRGYSEYFDSEVEPVVPAKSSDGIAVGEMISLSGFEDQDIRISITSDTEEN